MLHLHLAETQKWIEEIIEVKGADYVYPHWESGLCRYYEPHTMQPSCIVGHLLDRVGLTPESKPPWNDADVLGLTKGYPTGSEFFGVVAGADAYGPVLAMDDDAREYLLNLQVYQDQGVPWGEANRRASAFPE